MRRQRGTGSIERYQDATGAWRYRARIVLPSGRRVPAGVRATEKEAQILLNEALERMEAGKAVDVAAGVTVQQWGKSFLDQREEQGIRGIKTERNRWKNLVDASPLADVVLRAVVRRDAKQWLAWLQGRKIKYRHAHSKNGKKLSRVTLQNTLNLIRKAFDVALDDELVTVNPFAGVRLPRNPGRTHEPWTYLTPEEQDALIVAAPIEEWMLVAFAIGSGLRQSEQWSLRWEDVPLVNGAGPQIVVRYGAEGKPTKSGRIRRVPVLPMTGNALHYCVRRAGIHKLTGLVFPAPHGGRRDNGPPHWWKDAVCAAGITRNVRWHDLRHTCASSLVAGWWGRKWSLEEVKEMLGHASITTTERYAHLAESEIQKAARETTLAGVGGREPPSVAGETQRARPVDGACEPARLSNADMPAISPEVAEDAPEAPSALHPHSLVESRCAAPGAPETTRTSDQRFRKACETVAISRELGLIVPLAGHQEFDPRCDRSSNPEAPAWRRSGMASTEPERGDGHLMPGLTARPVASSTEDPTVPAEVARRAGLCPMLLAAAYQDVMARRAGR